MWIYLVSCLGVALCASVLGLVIMCKYLASLSVGAVAAALWLDLDGCGASAASIGLNNSLGNNILSILYTIKRLFILHSPCNLCSHDLSLHRHLSYLFAPSVHNP